MSPELTTSGVAQPDEPSRETVVQEALATLAAIRLEDVSVQVVLDLVAQVAKRTLLADGEVSVTPVEDDRPRTVVTTGGLASVLRRATVRGGCRTLRRRRVVWPGRARVGHGDRDPVGPLRRAGPRRRV